MSDTVRIWNVAPGKVTEAKTLYAGKNAIKGYVESLPIWNQRWKIKKNKLNLTEPKLTITSQISFNITNLFTKMCEHFISFRFNIWTFKFMHHL